MGSFGSPRMAWLAAASAVAVPPAACPPPAHLTQPYARCQRQTTLWCDSRARVWDVTPGSGDAAMRTGLLIVTKTVHGNLPHGMEHIVLRRGIPAPQIPEVANQGPTPSESSPQPQRGAPSHTTRVQDLRVCVGACGRAREGRTAVARSRSGADAARRPSYGRCTVYSRTPQRVSSAPCTGIPHRCWEGRRCTAAAARDASSLGASVSNTNERISRGRSVPHPFSCAIAATLCAPSPPPSIKIGCTRACEVVQRGGWWPCWCCAQHMFMGVEGGDRDPAHS
jgi:hypothetical protein